MDFRDELYFLSITVLQEAGGESFKGKLGVAYTIMNRGGSVMDTVLKSYQFSCWNTDSPTRMSIDTTPEDVLRECYKAACAAYFKLNPDPTKGANQFLNEELTKKIRDGSLPGWFDEAKVTARIGKHTFLKLD